jgi:hypothetical protein
MAFKIDMSSPDVDKQLALLKYYPEIVKKHFRPRMFQAVRGLESRIAGSIPSKTGRARNTFGSKVSGSGINMTGRVGWYDKDDPIYPNMLEYGVGSHKIGQYVPGLGVYIDVHPGFSAIGFMAAGFSAMEGQISASMAQASEAVVNEMVVP